MARTLAEWLAYQERVNVHSIELGLDRVRQVWDRMGAAAPAPRVLTVGGTNGKGSTVALLESMLRAGGLRVGCFTSPHLLQYNERIRIDGVDADDASLINAFERIEAARGEIPLTYFEFGTLAALDLFARANLDVAVLEVGLGGRLDAVNIVDADVAVITTIDLDHVDWLGPDRNSIGYEKAGISRQNRPAIVGELEPPTGLLDELRARGARVVQAGRDFSVERAAVGWRWHHRDGTTMELPDPALVAPAQFANAATAIAALHALYVDRLLQITGEFFDAVSGGLRTAHASARLQSLGGDPELIVDVAHNPQAAKALADWLAQQPATRIHAVYGALMDKDAVGVMTALQHRVDHWHLAGLDGITARGMNVYALAKLLRQVNPSAAFDLHGDVSSALAAARESAASGDRILAFGSFFVASVALAERGE